MSEEPTTREVAEGAAAVAYDAKAASREAARKARLADAQAQQASEAAALPPPPSPEEVARELQFDHTMETAARFRWSPRARRTKAFEKFEIRLRELEARRSQALREIERLRGRLSTAGREYEAQLTAWHRDRRGDRPVDPRPQVEQAIRDAQSDYDALVRLTTEALEEKADWVTKHRVGVVRDIQAAEDEAVARYCTLVKELLDARQLLIDLRSDELGLRLFGHDAARSPGGTPPIPSGNLAEVREAIGGQVHPVTPEVLVKAVEADARFLRQRLTEQQRQALRERGEVGARLYEDAQWVQSEEYQQQIRDEVRRRRESYEREWGRKPSW